MNSLNLLSFQEIKNHRIKENLSIEKTIHEQVNKLKILNNDYHCLTDTIFFPHINYTEGPLSGIGFIHKDIFELNHYDPGFGYNQGAINSKTSNARVIELLENTGASILAKAVMVPYACGATSQNNFFPRCINPINKNYVVGGSSSGSAVAVASGMTPASLSTDTTGSIRIPAASCGVLGLKTTKDIISLAGVKKLAQSLDSVGIIASHTEDVKILLNIISEITLPIAQENVNIALWIPPIDDYQFSQSIRQTIANHQLHVQPIEIPEYEKLQNLTDTILNFEVFQNFSHLLGTPAITKSLSTICKIGQKISPDTYYDALNQREFQIEEFTRHYFQNFEIILMPCFTCSLPNWQDVEIGHPHFDKIKLKGLYELMGFINYLGLPAISLPIGQDAYGRPLSIQAIGKPHSEHTLIAFAERIAYD